MSKKFNSTAQVQLHLLDTIKSIQLSTNCNVVEPIDYIGSVLTDTEIQRLTKALENDGFAVAHDPRFYRESNMRVHELAELLYKQIAEGPVKIANEIDDMCFSEIVDECGAEVHPHYRKLYTELMEALNQAQGGKGKERHANGEPFEKQKILWITRLIEGSPISPILFQVVKKALESARMEPKAAYRELKGVINYAGACMIRLKEIIETEEPG